MKSSVDGTTAEWRTHRGKKSAQWMTGQHKLPDPSKREKRDRKDEQSHRDLGTKTKDVTFIMLLKSQ